MLRTFCDCSSGGGGGADTVLVLTVCYIPPESSSCTAGGEETLQALNEGVEKYDSMGPIVICGDFNVRCA